MTRSSIILTADNCNMKYVSQIPEISSQLIIKFDNKYIWNFNADDTEKCIGRCCPQDKWMLLAGCVTGKWYKRTVYIDPIQEVILEEMTDEEIQTYQESLSSRQAERNSIGGNNNEVATTTYENVSNNRTFIQRDTGNILMTFEN